MLYITYDKQTGRQAWRVGYAQICDLVRTRVARRELQPGDRWRWSGSWPGELGVNVNTVARPTPSWPARGWWSPTPGGGTRRPQPKALSTSGFGRTRLGEIVGSAGLQALGLGYARADRGGGARTAGPLAGRVVGRAAQPPAEQTVLFAGSHDLTLDLLAARLQRRAPPARLQTEFRGSLEGLMALAHDESTWPAATCSTSRPASTTRRSSPACCRQPIVLVTLARREQGLMMRPATRRRSGHANRPGPPGRDGRHPSARLGDQVLLEHELRRAGLGPTAPRTSERVYGTHVAVAGAVAEGGADVGLGIRGRPAPSAWISCRSPPSSMS